jgi:hypothetical protein
MTKCEICDQELTNGEFEEKLGICVDCIMIDCRKDSFKSLLTVFLIFVAWIMFIVALLQVIFIVASLIGRSEIFSFLIIPVIICVMVGPGLIYLSVFHKFR